MQTEALKQQTKEFEAQVKELEETRKVVELQTGVIRKQQFENTFFKLIDLLVTTTEKVVYIKYGSIENTNYLGKEAFTHFARTHEIFMMRGRENVKDWFLGEMASEILHAEPVGKTIFRILRLVENEQLPDEDKHFYCGIIEGLLSGDEKRFLSFYGSFTEDQELIGLLIKYAICERAE